MAGDLLYWILVILGVIFGGQAFSLLCSVLEILFQGGSVSHSAGETARVLLDRLGFTDVAVAAADEKGPNAFDAESRQVRLKPSTFRAKRAGALAIAAHEVGHVVHAFRYPRLLAWKQRAAGQIGGVTLAAGLLLMAARFLQQPVFFPIGIIGYVLMIFLCALKWIEEIDASRRGVHLLSEADLLPPKGRRDAVIKLGLAFGTYLGLTLIFPVLYGFLIWS